MNGNKSSAYSRSQQLSRYRRLALFSALVLALTLFALDRTAAWLHRPGPDSTAVVIYTAEWCTYCRRLMAYLDAHAVPYTNHDVEKSFQGGMGFWALRGRGVPVSAIGPDIIYGFDLEKIGKSLTRLGYTLDAARHTDTEGQRGN